MAGNFDFLGYQQDLKQYETSAKNLEQLYGIGAYASVLTEARKIAENLVKGILGRAQIPVGARATFHENLKALRGTDTPKKVMDVFFAIKRWGNRATHNLDQGTQVEALKAIRAIYALLGWQFMARGGDRRRVADFEAPHQLYQTAERKLIYVQTADNSSGQWPAYDGAEKIGEASVPEGDFEANWEPGSGYLLGVAQKRINQYMTTAGVPGVAQWSELAYRKQDKTWFHDHDVHRVLDRSGIRHQPGLTGNEWYQMDLATAKRAIAAVKAGRAAIDQLAKAAAIALRPEQQDAINRTKKAFKKYDKMLWNAKMRFGKTITALQLIKEARYPHVLIMTHRPVVDDGWFDDFNKLGLPAVGYHYGSKKSGETFDHLVKNGGSFVYFASLQDLRGSEMVGGKAGNKNEVLFATDWDLVIVDEAHEGTQTELAQNVLDQVVWPGVTKVLTLSGTPFNLLDQYEEEQVFTWDYVMEQQAKVDWEKKHTDLPNPYEGLPQVSMFTFEMSRQFKDALFQNDDKRAFNFKAFFEVNAAECFVHEAKVKQFLDNITTSDAATNYPFSTPAFRERLRHTLWILPGVKEACALAMLLAAHPVFGMDYKIVNVVAQGDNGGIASESDVAQVKAAMGSDPAATKTITLTVRKLTTGVTIAPWTGVLFLANTASAMQYLQAAFRAQTPYASETFGRKTRCYVFDFAPDRALTVMAEATRLNTGVGKRTSDAQREKMKTLMNFLPIIGESGQGMQPYQVDTLLSQIKRVYAEKAVKSGFDDDSLYSDELLMLKDGDLSAFNDLKAIVGTTKKDKRPMTIDVNHQGLTDEQYDKAIGAEKKPKRDRTAEEQAAIDRMNALKKQRKTMISILRGISIRIPLMLYGLDVPIDEAVGVDKFVDAVDDASWAEFMPAGVTKALFRKFTKYYDADVFIEAGRIIRRKVKVLDDLSPIERAEALTPILATFCNPDKETVLTPWRVVNLQLGKTIGGLSFYDDAYEHQTVAGRPARHWITTPVSSRVYHWDTRILEINAKTGLYPLYAALSCFDEGQRRLAGPLPAAEQTRLWQQVLAKNVYVVAKTPMAAAIARRTLVGYHHWDTNIAYIDGLVAAARADVRDAAAKIEREFGKMKFDVVIGNPPYQEEVAKKETDNGQKRVTNIFHYFQILADKLAKDCTALIYPGGRWIQRSGKGMSKFGLEQINDPRLSKLIYFEDANDVFEQVEIPDGISIVLKKTGKTDKVFDYEFIKGGKSQCIKLTAPGEKILVLNPIEGKIAQKIDQFVEKNGLKYIADSKVINQKLFRIESDFVEKNPEKVKLLEENEVIDYSKNIKLFTNDKAGKTGRAKWYVVKREVIEHNANLIDEWKVTVSSANAGGQKRDNQISVMDNHSAFGRSRIALKVFKTQQEANNFLKYAKSKFIRFAFLLTDESLTSLGKEVPDILEYKDENAFIDFSRGVDQQLAKLLGLTEEETKYINNRVESLR